MKRFHRIKSRYFFCGCAFIFILSFYHYTHLRRPELVRRKDKAPVRNKLILSWESYYFGDPTYMIPNLTNLNCEFSSCVVTYNRSLFNASDAVAIHWTDVHLLDLPRKRENRKIILANFESPINVPNILGDIKGLIDWVATYRLDSDIYATYGLIKPLTENFHSLNNIGKKLNFHNKRLVAWLVSHCDAPTHRREVVEELISHGVSIDEYGRCPTGNNTLRHMNRDGAYGYLSKKYKFYLSFENTLCRDYATEKLFQPLYHGMVPVVFGGANYKKLLPKNSFIDILDFNSLKELSNHLINVGNNESLYSEYHEWRKYFYVSQHESTQHFFCEICDKLHNPDKMVIRRNPDLVKWWNEEQDCFDLDIDAKKITLESTRRKRDKLYSNAV